ncbi:MAG: proprotein convertase P-domain-containing protein, partial [Saprospiraceae bacterium]|nr:proprotein convertase P-domain-containing protein [Saprospiraceae bacterium]
MNHLNLKSSLMKNDFSPPSRAKQYLGMACLFLLGFLQPYLSYAQTFNGTTGPIPDATQDPDEYAISSTMDFTANVTGLFGTIGTDYTITNVTINIEHTWVDDLDISLVGPDGTTTLNLSDDNGDNGYHYTNTVFTDAASINITAGFPPFAGSFNPEGPGTLASVFNGSAVNGIWTLRITDDLNFEEGTLLSWSITFQAVNPPVVLNCPSSTTTTACQTQSAVNNAFALWLLTASATGGCNGVLSNNNVAQGGAPPACGGSRTVTFTYTSTCLPFTTTCQATFTVPTAPTIVLTCPTNTTTTACQTQAAVDAAFATWLATASGTGGCNGTLTNNSVALGGAPPACGGSRTVTFIYTSTCGTTTTTCQATFTVPAAPTVMLTCPTNQTEAFGQTQAAIDAKFATWLAIASASGGCGGTFTNNNTGAPPATGGSVTVTFTKTSTCAPLTTTCQASFTVSSTPPVVLNCPVNATASSPCLTQAQLTAEYNAWLATATASGGCNGVLTNNSPGAPSICSPTVISQTVTFTYTSTCAPLVTTCQATFTVPAYPDFNGPPSSGATRVCLAQTEQPIPPVISDACGKPIIPTGPVVVDAPNPLTCEGTRTYIFTYTDCAGHSKDWSFVWTLDVPTLSVDAPGTATVPCPSFTPPTYPNTITDACGRPVTVTGPTVTSSPAPITCEGTKTYTWNLTDCAGNTNTWSWIITIERNDFTLPANGGSTVACPSAANVVPTPPSKMSECGEPIIPTGPVVTATPACEGTKTYTWTYT